MTTQMTTQMTTEELELWQRYRGQFDQEARDGLVQYHMPFVHYLARQMSRRSGMRVELDDLVSAGALGLLHAVERFEPSRGFVFSTFAARRISGAMLDEIRSSSLVKRTGTRHARKIVTARARVESRLCRPAREQEIVAELGVDVGEFRSWERDAFRVEVQLNDEISDSGYLAGERDSDRAVWLSEAIRELPATERKVLALTYYEGLPGREIAGSIGLTESRVSQIKKRAVERLRQMAPAQVAACA